ncbi:MAG: hypothetical protein SRB1_01147, partial [Desulfobacteraceae bacterium Eth-SRB1]
LYAEGKGLLDLKNEVYRESHSFYRIKKEVAERRDGSERHYYLPTSTTLWSSLKNLFRLIDKGSKSLGIDDIIHVPAYNGGLFDPGKTPFLETWDIGDRFLADAIDFLSRSSVPDSSHQVARPRGSHRNGGDLGFVDYSTLEIRHLGSIYEGLLEYRLKVAKEDLVVTGGKARKWVILEEFNGAKKKKKSFDEFDEFDKIRRDELYLATDKGERKATGSYYTPDYIVNYIVENTISPVVAEKWRESEESHSSFTDATLSVKILDPAMGSGHFLVGAVEFLARKLMEAAQKDIEAGLVEDDGHFTNDWARREAVSHCIYGVDLNELAVELAKVSLWLTSISKDKPLSFLDHRLKQGNSLIGTRLADLKYYPGIKKKEKDQTTLPSFISPLFITHLIGKIEELEKIEDERLEDIKKKEKVFKEFKQLPEYRKARALANVYTAVYFGNEVAPTQNKDSANVYYDLFWAIMGEEDEWDKKTKREWFTRANQIAQEKSFFHWELEFPDVFFEDGGVKENPRWDCVIGNPPYGYVQDEASKIFIKQNYRFKENKYELYNFFMEKGIFLSRKNGLFSFIVPISWMEYIRTVKLRQILLTETRFLNLCRLLENPFAEANVEPCIFILKNQIPSDSKETVCTIFDHQLTIKNQYAYNQKDWHKNIDSKIILKIDNSHNLLNENISIKLSDLVEAIQGIIPYHLPEFTKKLGKEKAENIVKNRLYHAKFQKESDYRRVLLGSDIGRYQLNWASGEWLKYGPWLARAKEERFFSHPRILVQRIRNLRLVRRIIATYVEEDYLNEAGLATIIQKDKNYSLHFILSILNSVLINKFFRENFFDTNVKPTDILKIPIRIISFTTPSEERTPLVESLKSKYNANEFDKIIQLVEECLPKDTEGNFLTDEEKSDVVHDLLAYLAERMIEMNKEKNKEMKGFLEWFEREIGAKIETLTNRTKLKRYYDIDFDGLLDILKKNKKKIPINLSNRQFQANLKNEFDQSLSKLKPMMDRIEKTDWLIDQAVYRLYGLTDEELEVLQNNRSQKEAR